MAHETFKEISIGGVAKEALLRRLVDAGVRMNEYAKVLFEDPSLSPSLESKKVKLVKMSLSELGLSNPCSLEDVIDRGARLGLKVCPLDLGAFLRLEFLEQLEGPYLTIASLRLQINENYPTGFYLRNIDGSLWLRGYRATGDSDWPQDNEFVFIKEET